MKTKKCKICGGSGDKFLAPRGVNPFTVRIEQLSRVLRKVRCWDCEGTGYVKSPPR